MQYKQKSKNKECLRNPFFLALWFALFMINAFSLFLNPEKDVGSVLGTGRGADLHLSARRL